MATYQVVLRVEVYDEDVVRNKDRESLRDLKAGDTKNYLAEYVEGELGWLEHSFSGIEVESIKRLKTTCTTGAKA